MLLSCGLPPSTMESQVRTTPGESSPLCEYHEGVRSLEKEDDASSFFVCILSIEGCINHVFTFCIFWCLDNLKILPAGEPLLLSRPASSEIVSAWKWACLPYPNQPGAGWVYTPSHPLHLPRMQQANTSPTLNHPRFRHQHPKAHQNYSNRPILNVYCPLLCPAHGNPIKAVALSVHLLLCPCPNQNLVHPHGSTWDSSSPGKCKQ